MYASAPLPSGPPPSRAVDEQHIVQTLITVATAFATFNAEALHTSYTPDADWIDAGGIALYGRDAIVDHLRQRFAVPHLTASSLVGHPTLSLRWVHDDVVIATTYLERRSHRKTDGCSPSRRRTHSLKVLTRSDHHTWLIVSEISADARVDE